MRYPSIASCISVAGVLAAVGVFVLSGCSNNNGSVAATPRALRPVSPDASVFYSINNPNGLDNEVTGINDNRLVIGNYANTPTGPWQSYTSSYSDQFSSFVPVDYPDATNGTFMTAISTPPSTPPGQSPIEVGWVDNPSGETGRGLYGVWGAVSNQGLWSLINRYKDENMCQKSSSEIATAELLGFDANTDNAVGFYESYKNGCRQVAYEVAEGDNPSDIGPPLSAGWKWTEATGITSEGGSAGVIIVGTASMQTGTNLTYGWYLQGGNYTTLQYNNNSTSFNSVAVVKGFDVIVGSYTDSQGTHAVTYEPSTHQWTTVSVFGAQTAVIDGINKNGDICGWYQIGNGDSPYHGFVEIVGSLSPRHKVQAVPR